MSSSRENTPLLNNNPAAYTSQPENSHRFFVNRNKSIGTGGLILTLFIISGAFRIFAPLPSQETNTKVSNILLGSAVLLALIECCCSCSYKTEEEISVSPRNSV